MPLNVGKEIATLKRMNVRELRMRYAEVFSEETRTGNKSWLVKRVAWRLQSLADRRFAQAHEHFEQWPWAKLAIDAEHIAEAVALFDR